MALFWMISSYFIEPVNNRSLPQMFCDCSIKFVFQGLQAEIVGSVIPNEQREAGHNQEDERCKNIECHRFTENFYLSSLSFAWWQVLAFVPGWWRNNANKRMFQMRERERLSFLLKHCLSVLLLDRLSKTNTWTNAVLLSDEAEGSAHAEPRYWMKWISSLVSGTHWQIQFL